jgi:predicted PurR-regulated permease PerM
MTRGVFLSVGLTAAVQAALGLIGFLVLGVPHAGTLSALMFFLALVPGGVALVGPGRDLARARREHVAATFMVF